MIHILEYNATMWPSLNYRLAPQCGLVKLFFEKLKIFMLNHNVVWSEKRTGGLNS